MAQVKICGLRSEAAIEAAVTAGADWIGFVFAPKSPRYITPEDAARLAKPAVRRAVKIVALTVDAPFETLNAIAASLAPDVIQLHGAESPKKASVIGGLHDWDVWKAVPVASAADLETASEYPTIARLLLDARGPEGAPYDGGNGAAFDWTLTQGWTAPKPWLLAGGLSPENVAEAIRVTGAEAVDVSSGVEAAPGVKDPAKIRAFIQAAKNA